MTATAIHPEAVAGGALWWVVNTDAVPVGRVRDAPGELGDLLASGVLARVLVERGAVWTWLRGDLAWPEWGPRVRSAVADAVAVQGWRVERCAELLGLVARDVVDRQLGGFIGSHGGIITVLDATDDVLVCDLAGACTDCPAAALTLQGRIQRAVTARYPMLQEVRRSRRNGERS